jgi:hypothetical protein
MLTWAAALLGALVSGFVTFIEEGPEAAMYQFKQAIDFLWQEVDAVLPGIGEAFQGMTNQMQFAIEVIAGAWDWLVGKFESGIDMFGRAAGYIKGLFGAGGDAGIPAIPSDIQNAQEQNMANIQRGGALLSSANTPLASQTSSSITNGATNRTSNKTTNVTTGPITVNTQATDGNQVASAMGNTLRNEMRSAIDENDDGVVA